MPAVVRNGTPIECNEVVVCRARVVIVLGPIADAEVEIPKVIESQAAKVVRVAHLAEAGHFASGTVEIDCKV